MDNKVERIQAEAIVFVQKYKSAIWKCFCKVWNRWSYDQNGREDK